MKSKRGKLSTYINIGLVLFLLVNVTLTLFFFFGSSSKKFLSPEIATNTTRFLFSLEETNESLEGSVFVGEEFFGQTTNGAILIKNSSKIRSQNLTFITPHGQENYSFSFEIPENIGEIDRMNYVVSKEHFTVPYKDYIDDYSKVREPHWGHIPLSYVVENPSVCTNAELERLKTAFDLITNLTNNTINFTIKSPPDITVVCSNLKEELESKEQCKNITVNKNITSSMFYEEGVLNKSSEYLVKTISLELNGTNADYEVCFVNQSNVNFPLQHLDAVGLAVPTMKNNLIINATIYLNLDEPNVCSNHFPITEAHEILHIFGFDHFFEPETLPENISDAKLALMMQDIMSPWGSCFHQQKGIQQKYIDCLDYIYSNGETNKNCFNTKMYKTN